MLSSYITVDDVKDYGYQLDDTAAEGEGASDNAVLAKIIPRAARIFDVFAEVEPGYFGKAPDEAADRVIFGTGADYLVLPPYVAPLASDAITMPTGYTVPAFYERQDRYGVQFLQRQYANQPLSLMDPDGWPLWGSPEPTALQFMLGRAGWPCVPITVNARWGFADVPEDVKEAVLELSIVIWRGKDPAFAKIIRLDDKEIISQALPDRTKQIAAKYADQRAPEVGI
jgi:hypothetical protein